MAEDRVALTRRAFQLYVGGDVEGMLELYSPDVEVTAPDFMNAGPFRGHEGYMEWLRRWNEAWDSFNFDIRAIEPVGELHVVASVLVSGRGRGSGWRSARCRIGSPRFATDGAPTSRS